MRKVNQTGIDFFRREEAVRSTVYQCSAAHWTIGVGHKLTDTEISTGRLLINGNEIDWREGLTPKQIDDLLEQDLSIAEWGVEKYVRVPTSDNQFCSLVSLAFNIGNTEFRDSSVVRVLNQGRYDLVPGFFRLFNKVTKIYCMPEGGCKPIKEVDQGLIKRREAEIKLWLNG